MGRRLIQFSLILIVLSISVNRVSAQTILPKLKSAFILRFADNITWQNESEIKTFRIGLFGNDTQTFDALESAAKERTIRNKPIEIIEIRRINDVNNLQLLYVSESEIAKIDEIYPRIELKNILLITEECTEPQYIMLNIFYNSNSQSVSFQINKANLIIENFSIDPNLLLLGGTEVDVREVYQQMRLQLSEESKNVLKQKELLRIQEIQMDSQATKINEQNSITSVLLKNVEDLKGEIELKESDLAVLSTKINNQELILKSKTAQIATQEADFQKLNNQITESGKKIETKTRELEQLTTESDKQQKEIEKQKSVLSSKESFIKTQTKYIYSVIAFSIALLLLGYSIWNAYKVKKRANETLEDRVALRTKELEDEILERRQVELELINATRKAEESDRLKTAFLQNMSHEIRTPMNAIMGFSELLIENIEDNSKLRYFTDIIKHRSNDLLDIINDILHIAKIESGQLPLKLEETNLNYLFDELRIFFKEYQKRLDKEELELSFQTLNSIPPIVIITDPVKLKQIFINLISNALKFTKEGKIEGGYKLDGDKDLIFYVTDTGIGIPKDKQQAIFERFTQLKQNSKLNVGGTGLGLSIVKGLVSLLGSEIVLESEPGIGSTFSFKLPYNKSIHTDLKEPDPGIPELINLNHQTILIVEDDQFNAEYLMEVLSGKGLNILHVDNGEDAVNTAKTQPIDLVLMDIRLPDIDGKDAVAQILKHKPKMKIIAQTAYASNEELQNTLAAGCIDFITKPTKASLLISMVNKHLS
jgi:signal transduction histidine kinase/CheY-like chemotaxis protein